jgi:hypothetical protein
MPGPARLSVVRLRGTAETTLKASDQHSAVLPCLVRVGFKHRSFTRPDRGPPTCQSKCETNRTSSKQ